MRRAAKVDRNHGEIVAALRAIGCFVWDTSACGNGAPDLVAMRGGVWRAIEVKDGERPPSERKLTADQVKFHGQVAAHGGTVYVVQSVQDVLDIMGAQ